VVGEWWVVDELNSNPVGITTIKTPSTVTVCPWGRDDLDVSG
ncbi:uncharacterized protein METZ01_LOCUS274239, partial [marine metagenome]